MAAIHLEDCPGVFSRLPCTSILGWPVLWRLIFCLLLPTVVSAQEVYLPDVTTVIAGEELEVAEEIHISQAQVSRLEKNALKSMRKYLS